jgi:hypothetical protein
MDLSEDEDNSETLEQLLQKQRDKEEGRRKRGQSKKAEKGAVGGKRSKAFTPPIPLEYQKLPEGGYQLYILPNSKLVYQRREFVYEDQYKVGNPIVATPTPPTLFSDTYLFQKSKRLLLECLASNVLDLTPHDKLVHRIVTRVIRLSSNFFVDVSLTKPSDADAMAAANALLAAANANVELVFSTDTLKHVYGEQYEGWNLKQACLLRRFLHAPCSTRTPLAPHTRCPSH